MNPDELKIVFFGAGVIGGSVGAWVATRHDETYFLDQGEVAKSLREKGITQYWGDEPDKKVHTDLKVIGSLDEVPDADVIFIGVKNYSLPTVCEIIKKQVGDHPVIVGMQNGLDNQRILPEHFSKVIFCIVSYNAWLDEPGLIGYQKHGPLHIGTLKDELQEEKKAIAAVLNKGVETHIDDRIADAAHCKLVINLTNSLTTLIGMGFREITDRDLFQTLLSGLTWEGVQIIKAAGYKEVKLGGMPPWLILWAGAKLPKLITRPLFEKNVRKMVISSMAQDIIQRGGSDSELESINGYLLKLADKSGHPAPFNRAIYELAKKEFAKDKFEPLDVKEVWEAVAKKL